MTVRQDRYVDPDTSVVKVKEADAIEAPKIPDNPTLRALDVQQSVNSSTLPISSRAVKLAIDGMEIPSLDGYATEAYVDSGIGAVDAKITSTNANATKAQERADSAYSLADSKVDGSYVDGRLVDYVSTESINSTLATYAKTSEVDNKISNYSTTVDVRLESLNTDVVLASGKAVEAQERADDAYLLAESKTDKSYVDSKVGSIDLSIYALKSDLSSYLTIESAGSLATKEELGSYATTQYVDSGLTLKADKSQLEGLATKAWVEERLIEFMVEVKEEIEKSQNGEPADGGV